ncbi:MAG: mechanosensitive ion channel [Spirochaeta sp.]|jgi:small-conductance mechanosensitive channel|nr:mechanosensitive ion channel [Spirochaeta sp.]
MLFDRWFRFTETLAVPPWLPQWTLGVVLPVATLLAYAILSRIVPYLFSGARRGTIRLVFRRTRFPVQLILLVVVAERVLVRILPETSTALIERTVPLLLVAAVALLAYRLTGTLFVALRGHFDISAADNLTARRVTTQIVILERLVGFTIVILAVAVGLVTIPGVRQWGASLLASAGILGLLVGFAAQQTIANVLAGIQIAITQPLRIEDSVVIDGEWGWVEEITLTYVVVRIWDRRRLVVPISYLLQKPFQNWTRSTASIIGSVYLYADYTVDIDALRVEQTRTLAASDLWDGDVDVIQVTNTTERTVELRSLVSARNAPQAWELRCHLRERLVSALKTGQPGALPRERMRIQGTITGKDTDTAS